MPALVFSTGMPMLFAIGSSLLRVATFGMTMAVNYAISGFIDWPVAAECIGGGFIGGCIGMQLACRRSDRNAALSRIFGCLVCIFGSYVLYRNLAALRPV